MSLTETRPDGGSDSLGIPLPAGSGARAIHRRRRRQERRQRRLFLSAAALAVLGVLTWFSASQIGRQLGESSGPPAVATPVVSDPKVLLAHRHPDGSARSITIFSDADELQAIVLIPPGTMAEVPSLGLEPLGRALQVGGPTRLRSTVENLLGIDVSHVVVVDDADLVALAEPLDDLEVEVPARVEQVADDGAVDVLYEPGRIRIGADEVPTFLSAKGTSTDLAVLSRHQSFWEAVLADVAEGGSLGGPEPLQEVLDSLAAGGAVRSRLLPVEPIGQSDPLSTGTAATELYQVEDDELERFLESTFPGGEDAAVRPKAQVLNGTGGVEVSAHAAEKLVPAGIQVALTGNAPRFDYRTTQIVFYDESEKEMAERARRALGVGRLVLSRRPLGVVDLTIIIGADFRGSSSQPTMGSAPTTEAEPTNRRT
jgi:hypothetical protein